MIAPPGTPGAATIVIPNIIMNPAILVNSKGIPDISMDWADSSEANRAEYLEERKMWNALLVHWNELNSRTKARVNTTFLTFNKIAGIAAMFALVLAFSWYMAEYAGVDSQKGIPLIYEVKTNDDGTTEHTGNIIPATNENMATNRMRNIVIDTNRCHWHSFV